MAFLFAKPVTAAEQLKKHKREIDRAIRDLERERSKLQMQEKKIIAEIRKAAAQNQQVSLSPPLSPCTLAVCTQPRLSSNPRTRTLPHRRRACWLRPAVGSQDHGEGSGADT